LNRRAMSHDSGADFTPNEIDESETFAMTYAGECVFTNLG